MKKMYIYDVQYIIEILQNEGDELFEKLHENMPEALKRDFAKYESIQDRLVMLNAELKALTN